MPVETPVLTNAKVVTKQLTALWSRLWDATVQQAALSAR